MIIEAFICFENLCCIYVFTPFKVQCFMLHLHQWIMDHDLKKYADALFVNLFFYWVNTSYPMDNYFTGQHDRSRQMPEKDVLYIILAGPVTESAFARCRLILPSCQDSMTS